MKKGWLDNPEDDKPTKQDSLDLYNFTMFQKNLEQSSDRVPTTPWEALTTLQSIKYTDIGRKNQKLITEEAQRILKSNPHLKPGLAGSYEKPTAADYALNHSFDIYHPDIKPKGVWFGTALNNDYSNVKPKGSVGTVQKVDYDIQEVPFQAPPAKQSATKKVESKSVVTQKQPVSSPDSLKKLMDVKYFHNTGNGEVPVNYEEYKKIRGFKYGGELNSQESVPVNKVIDLKLPVNHERDYFTYGYAFPSRDKIPEVGMGFNYKINNHFNVGANVNTFPSFGARVGYKFREGGKLNPEDDFLTNLINQKPTTSVDNTKVNIQRDISPITEVTPFNEKQTFDYITSPRSFGHIAGSSTENLPNQVQKMYAAENYYGNNNERRLEANDYNWKIDEEGSKTTTNLTSGRFKGAKVPNYVLSDLISAAVKQGVDPYDMLALAGRESTFGSDLRKDYDILRKDKSLLVSGWSVDESYRPYSLNRFLADKNLPSTNTTKGKEGYKYTFNEEAVSKYITEHPEIEQEYMNKLIKTPTIGTLNSLDLAAQFIKEKGFAKYNPGDKDYTNKINKDINLLKADSNLTSFVNKELGKYASSENKRLVAGQANPMEFRNGGKVPPGDNLDLTSHPNFLDASPKISNLQNIPGRAYAEKMYNTVAPTGYNDMGNFYRYATDTKRTDFNEVDPISEEGYKQYLGINDNPKYLSKSEYKPSISTNPNASYYKLPDSVEQNIWKHGKYMNGTSNIVGEMDLDEKMQGWNDYSVLGNLKISRGSDSLGDYVSYYDKYDLPDYAQKRLKGTPYEFYNKQYLPKQSKHEAMDEALRRYDAQKETKKNGGWLDE